MSLSSVDQLAPPAQRTPDDPESHSHRTLTLGTALGLLFGALGFLIGSRIISDNSFLTHFANGRLVLDGKGIPRVDPYSFTAAGEKVTVQSWLPTILYAWLDVNVGGWSVRLLNGALAAAIGSGLWRLGAAAKQLLPRVVLVGMAVGVGSVMWGPRPLLFGLVCMVGLFLVRQRDLALWTLVPIMWIWVNSHGSFPLGLAALAAFAVGRSIDDRSVAWNDVRVLAWATLATVGGALNPLGFDLLLFPVHLMKRREALAAVAEWSSPDFAGPLGLLLVGFMGLLVLSAARGARWEALLPGCAFAFGSMLAVRNLAPAAVVFVVAIAPTIDVGGSSLSASARGLMPRAITALSIVGVALSIMLVIGRAPTSFERYPTKSVDWLDARGLVATPEVRLVHRDIVGNYLELRYGDAANVFIDDRFDFYPIEVLDDHRALFFGGDYREILDRYGADVVLWDADSGFGQWLEEAPEWVVAHRTDDWLIACRAGSAAADRCT